MNNVRLIAITQPVSIEFLSDPKPENLISYTARVSNPSNQENFDTSEKLLQYCIDHKHWSIFEMVNVVMEIETTRDIARQILRHRSFSFQEFSQRYADPNDDLGYFIREARDQDKTNRQNSTPTLNKQNAIDWYIIQQRLIKIVKELYAEATSLNIAKEQKRALLPEGLIKSRMYVNGTLRSWIHYCDLRRGMETQKEHRVIAEQCWDILKEEFEFLKTYEHQN